jgi:hypothetical protein
MLLVLVYTHQAQNNPMAAKPADISPVKHMLFTDKYKKRAKVRGCQFPNSYYIWPSQIFEQLFLVFEQHSYCFYYYFYTMIHSCQNWYKYLWWWKNNGMMMSMMMSFEVASSVDSCVRSYM